MLTIGLNQEKEYFIEQLSMLIAAGVPITSAMSSIENEIKSKRFKKIINSIKIDINSGFSISAALLKSGIFNKSIISGIRIGEESGQLAENLKTQALQEQKNNEFKSKISSAIMYPGFVFILTIIIGLGTSWFILPRLASVFSSLRIELPLVTRLLISFGNFLGKYGFIVIPTFLSLSILLFFFIFIFSKTNFLGQEILFLFPPIAKLFIEVELSRLGFLLGNLLTSGVPILDSLASFYESTTLRRYRKFYAFLYDKVKEGNSFSKCFAVYKNVNKLIPAPIQQLIITGEESGSLPTTFKNIGERYEKKIETTTKNISVLLEPALLVIVWLGVVAVALAVILPLYSLIGNLNP